MKNIIADSNSYKKSKNPLKYATTRSTLVTDIMVEIARDGKIAVTALS